MELAKLDKQIRDVKGGPSSERVIERLVANNNLLFDALRDTKAIDEFDHAQRISKCPCAVRRAMKV
jgi:hypothetical protein